MEIFGMQTGYNSMRGQTLPRRELNRVAGASPVNVGSIERVVSALFGAFIIYRAVKNRRLASLLMGPLGLSLVNRGVSGVCPAYGKLGISSARTS